MRFAPTDDQAALREGFTALLASRCPPSVVREAWVAAPGKLLDAPLWAEISDMGALHVLVPAEHGGLGLDEVALVGLLEEAGRHAVPHPLVETAAVAAPLLGDGVGDVVGASWDGAPVPCAADCDRVVVVEADRVVLHERDELLVEGLDAVDGGRRLGRVTPAGPGVVLTDDPGEATRAFERGALGTAAVLVGLAGRMLDMAVGHVSERHQFGVPVGSFQAVKHQLADGLMALSFARPTVTQAAWEVAHRTPEAPRRVAEAKLLASEAAEAVGRAALQVHGAVGYTVEHDLHLFLKRSWALSRAWGSADWHADAIAASLGL